MKRIREKKKEKYVLYRWVMALLILVLLIGVAMLIWAPELGPDVLWLPSVKEL